MVFKAGNTTVAFRAYTGPGQDGAAFSRLIGLLCPVFIRPGSLPPRMAPTSRVLCGVRVMLVRLSSQLSARAQCRAAS